MGPLVIWCETTLIYACRDEHALDPITEMCYSLLGFDSTLKFAKFQKNTKVSHNIIGSRFYDILGKSLITAF